LDLVADPDSTYILGLGLAFLGTFLYACTYVITEVFLAGPLAMPPEALCYSVGFYGSAMSFLYLLLFTFPNWDTLVTQRWHSFSLPPFCWPEKTTTTTKTTSIEAHGGNHSRVFFLYLFLILLSYVHNNAYFKLMHSIGAGWCWFFLLLLPFLAVA